jgi:IS5 family transposase
MIAKDLSRSSLEQMINMGHPLVRLGPQIDWGFLERRLGEVHRSHDGHPPLPTRLVAGLLIIKHRSIGRR